MTGRWVSFWYIGTKRGVRHLVTDDTDPPMLACGLDKGERFDLHNAEKGDACQACVHAQMAAGAV